MFSTQRMKAVELFTQKLMDTIERNKEKCSMLRNENMKLEAETLHTQQEKTSLLEIQKALNNANIEQKKNILKAKEEEQEILEKVKNTAKKYDDLWEVSKAQYESLPHVQKLLQANQDVTDIRERIRKLEIDIKDMIQQIRKNEEASKAKDQERIIKFAEYMVIERAKMLELIKVKTAQIQVIREKINILKIEKKVGGDEHIEESKANNQSASIMPRLQRDHFDFDTLNVMDKIRGDDFNNTAPNSSYSIHSAFVVDPTKITKKKTDNYLSTFYGNPYAIFYNEANKTQNIDNKKLIHVLEDIRIDQNKAKRFKADVNPDELQPIEAIAASDNNKPDNIQGLSQRKENQEDDVLENVEIEEIDLTATYREELVTPPSQFMDKTQVTEIQSAPSTSEFMFGVNPSMTSTFMEEGSMNATDGEFTYTGLRKSGLSFFDNMGATSEPDSAQKPATSAFNFKGNDEKKNSGGGFF